MVLKGAYDDVLRKKGLVDPDAALFQSEPNEYIISHNTRPSVDSVQCEECHERKQGGVFSALISPNGLFGNKEIEVKGRSTIPDPRLVAEGHIVLDMKYTKMKPNGDLVQSVDDILVETKIDPFMSLLKNSSVDEVTGEFRKISRDSTFSLVGSELATSMSPDLPSADHFLFVVNKGNVALRNMAALIDGNTVNSLLFPTYRGALGMLKESIPATEDILNNQGYGKLRSDVFYFDVRDAAKKQVTFFNDAFMFIKVTYKGNKTNLNEINVVIADWAVTSVRTVPEPELVAIQPATELAEGFVIFKMTEPGYFVIADK
jgi:hypothetical protein